MSLPPTAPLRELASDTLAAFRARLAGAGYDHAVVHEAESLPGAPVRYGRSPVVRWWLARRNEPRADLARLFAFDEALPEERVTTLLGSELVAALLGAGFLVREGGGLRSAFLLYPMRDGPLVASDALWSGDDAAMGPGAGTAFLAGMIPPAFAGSLLDVGCGAGSLALVAAMRGARRAVGVDINPRAIELARFNAALNGVRAEFFAGDLTRPVAGERFDRVVAQPAFVARPAGSEGITYLHGGERGDELALRLLSECPAVLAEGGRAMVFFQSPARESGTVTGRLREALGEAAGDLDLLALKSEGAPTVLQATVFASYESAQPDGRYDDAVRRYLDHFDATGTRSVDGLFAVVGSPDAARAAARRYAVALPMTSGEVTHVELDALLARLELSGDDDAAVLAARLRVAAGARVVSERDGVGREAPARLRLELPPRSLGVTEELTQDHLERLRAFEGAASAERALVAYARGRKKLPKELRDDWLAWVRASLVRGRLTVDAG